MRHIFLIGCALSLVSTAYAEKPGCTGLQDGTELLRQLASWPVEKPGWTEYKRDGTIKARAEPEFRDGRIIKTEIFDSGGRHECVDYPVYGKDGRRSKNRRVLPDGRAWPYEYVVYGAASLGGISKLAADIKIIQETIAKIDTEYPILEIDFLSKDHVEVKTGIVKGPLNASGRYHDLKKEGNQWRNADEEGVVRMWVS